jgi:hypothetical protein
MGVEEGDDQYKELEFDIDRWVGADKQEREVPTRKEGISKKDDGSTLPKT